MLRLALLFLIIALIAWAVGAYALEGLALNIAWILFVVFLVLFILSAVIGVFRGRSPL